MAGHYTHSKPLALADALDRGVRQLEGSVVHELMQMKQCNGQGIMRRYV